jgi:hypothetical protein
MPDKDYNLCPHSGFQYFLHSKLPLYTVIIDHRSQHTHALKVYRGNRRWHRRYVVTVSKEH